MEGKYQIVSVAYVMIVCIAVSVADAKAMEMYSDQDSPMDPSLDSFMSSNNMRSFQKRNPEGILYQESDPIRTVEEYDERPTQSVPFKIATNSINNRDFDPAFGDSAYNNVYTDSVLGNNIIVDAIKDKSAFYIPSMDRGYPDNSDRKVRTGFVNIAPRDDDVYPFTNYEESQTSQGHYSDPYGTRIIGTLRSESPIDYNSLNSVVNERSKRHSNVYWRSIFGHQRPRPRQFGKHDNRPERKRYYGRRISFFDTLASRIIGK